MVTLLAFFVMVSSTTAFLFPDLSQGIVKISLPTDDVPDPKCGVSNMGLTLRRIYRGTPIAENDYPWVVYLNTGCAGTLISDRHILSAAHCAFLNINGTESKTIHNNIIATIHLLSGEEKNVKIKNVDRHPLYYGEDYGSPDIAIFTMENRVSGARRVCLPSNFNEFYGDVGVVVGYSNASGRPKANELVIPMNSPAKCEQILHKDLLWPSPVIFNKELFICAGSTERGTHGGDSGGPLMKNERGRWYQIGITSFGNWSTSSLGKLQDTGAYLRVSEHCSWIKEHTSGEVHCVNAAEVPLPSNSGRRRASARRMADSALIYSGYTN